MRMLSISMLLFALGTALSPATVYTVDLQISTSSVDQAFLSFTGEIKGNRVRMRLAPHTDSTIIKELSKGDLIAVLGESKDYYVVAAPLGLTGYVFRTFVLDNVIEGEQVNVRLNPTTSAPVLARLKRGTTVSPTTQVSQGKWLEIALPLDCVFYVAKNFVVSKGPIELYTQCERQKKIALDLLQSALEFAHTELTKNLNEIDLDAIYKKINLVQSEEFSSVPNLQVLVQKALEEIQEAYLSKSLEIQSAVPVASTSEEPVASSIHTSSSTSLLSRHIRKRATLKSSPLIQGRENLEHSLFKIWAAMQEFQNHSPSLKREDFYRAEQKNKQVLTGVLEVYPHIVKNNPGDYLLKDIVKENTTAFLYATNVNLDPWVGKPVVIECLPRPNNHFAFPAYYVLSIKEAS
ncbi:SH3 domain-containing protein [Candidatus Chlamydia sanziniae]|uniref:SH3b domain-containing protein n=1 Tax=Candidatus Chlamydia sanziniae TaxID=1806891 RepID=A0A1A9HV75_9CHLA|nr:SH3 domain-containing protein [Candidatus Chlamydia sanziniae]ANH78889.1 hypothetical protein Cs308_0719 [Candidatus Chlamydia sanziniae]